MHVSGGDFKKYCASFEFVSRKSNLIDYILMYVSRYAYNRRNKNFEPFTACTMQTNGIKARLLCIINVY